MEVNAVNTVRTVKREWKEAMTTMKKVFEIWTDKKENHHNLSAAIKKLEQEKQLNRKISLLGNSTDSIDQL